MMEPPVYLCVLLVFCSATTNAAKYKVCVLPEKQHLCNLLETSSDSQMECVQATDSADCAFKIGRGAAHLGAFSAEELLVAANFINDKSRVVAELRNIDRTNQHFDFEAVVLVKNNFTGGLPALKGLNYCHPGLGRSPKWNNRVLTFFESKALDVLKDQLPDCSSDWMAEPENYAFRLSKLFNKSCRPGKWSANDWLDKKLKSDYPNLCNLCDDQTSCEYNLDTTGSQTSALKCLTKGKGHVAYVALEYVRTYFNLNSTEGFAKSDSNGFLYLCQNGSTQSLKENNPCTWLKQPWKSLVIRHTEGDSPLTGILENIFSVSAPQRANWLETIKLILTEDSEKFVPLITKLSPREYLERGREVPVFTNNQKCRPNLRWGVTEEEMEKCNWLRYAALTHGVKPEVECIKRENTTKSLELITMGKMDIASIDTNDGYIARRVYNLTASEYVLTIKDASYYGVILLKTASSRITSVHDLRGKKGCFPQYNGLGWLTFLKAIRTNSSVIPVNQCPESESTWRVLMSACAPGAKQQEINPNADVTPPSLCAQCHPAANKTKPIGGGSKYCDLKPDNQFAGDGGALRCLYWGYGDVAFVNYNEIKRILESKEEPSMKLEDFNVLCQDGTIQPLHLINRDTCATVQVNGAEIVASKTISPAKRLNLLSFLEELDYNFGSGIKIKPVMKMYGAFNDTKNLIFKDNSVELTNNYHVENTLVHNYQTLQIKVSENCWYSSGTKLQVTFTTLLMVAITFLLNAY